MEHFAKLIDDLGRALGIDLSSDIESPFEIAIGGLPVVVSIENRDGVDEVFLHSHLGHVRPEQELEVYRVLLDANVLWSATEDCTLGVNLATRQAMICYRMPALGLDGTRLAEVVVAFAENATNWVNFVDGVQSRAEADQSIGALGGEAMIRI